MREYKKKCVFFLFIYNMKVSVLLLTLVGVCLSTESKSPLFTIELER